MITGFGGTVLLTWTSLYYGIVWLVVGMICTLLTERRGLYLAIILPILIPGFVTGLIFIVNAEPPNFQFFRYEGDVSTWLNFMVIPLFGSVIGGLLGELILPSVED